MNYLVLCLDSCRYDSFQKANAPNFKKVGALRKAYSVAGFTPPAIFGFMMNMPQYNDGRGKFIEGIELPCWLPEKFKEKGYFTAFFTPNPWIFKYKSVFGRGFDVFKGMDFNYRDASKQIINENINIFKTVKNPKFIFNLFLATHTPYARNGQVQAVEAVDEQFGRLLPYLSDTEVIICADHADLLREEGGEGHNPAERAVFHQKLFEVPIVRGRI